MISRRKLIKGLFGSGILVKDIFNGNTDAHTLFTTSQMNDDKMSRKNIEIKSVNNTFERESLISPFGFKGSALTELWQVVNLIETKSGIKKVGLGVQSVLWSSPEVYLSHSESGGNTLMYAINEYALQLIKGVTFKDPIMLQNSILDDVHDYAKKITGKNNLSQTFSLNALVALDNAIWLAYAAENDISNFDQMIPVEYRNGLSYKHAELAGVPLVSYGKEDVEIKSIADAGNYFIKIKIGQSGSQEEMLRKDKDYISQIHRIIGDYPSSKTRFGKILYYFDANGRYEKKETLLNFIDHLEKIGALNQVAVIEEPFPESATYNVADIPVRVAADESAHSDKDVLQRIQMGYTGIALKPIAKTLSMTLRMIKVAHERQIPCFCADLTVSPILVNWNKNVASRLAPLPDMHNGLLESNGPQNYKHWAEMETYLTKPDANWQRPRKGTFYLNEDFYNTSGGIFDDSKHYFELFNI